jgi:pimeloyl-ACP methyl ester carboxylesterase
MRLGSGAPLVVCHGSFCTAREWLGVAEHLANTRNVFLYDRRGRALSPYIAADFAIDAEADDLAVMVGLAGPGTAVLGHSFGGGCALRFAERVRFSGPLVLYEPRHSLGGPVSRGHTPPIEKLIAAGDRDGALHFVMSHVVGLPAQAIVVFRQSPQWELMCQTIDSFPKEVRLLDSLNWQAGDLDGISGEVTLLLGERSHLPSDEIARDEALRSLLPKMRTVRIPGQGHFAYAAAPALLADIVKGCLSGAYDG